MQADLANILLLPEMYWLSVVTLFGLAVEALIRSRERWAVPAAMVYLTIFGWYVMEPITSPETMADFSDEMINEAFFSVFIFLVTFRMLCTICASIMAPAASRAVDITQMPAERALLVTALVWLVLLAVGIYRMEGDVIATLFPLGSRSQSTMWQRPAGSDAGTFGFAISIGSYLYILVLALFGMLLPLLGQTRYRLLCVVLILIAWPYAFLQGSRNVTLAVFSPFVFSFLLFSRARLRTKIVVTLGSAVFIEWAMRQIITYRNVGFESGEDIVEQKHLGLNMASELVYCDSFLRSGILEMKLGKGFLAEAANVIPRFLMPNKPLIGIDYAIARGYGGGTQDIGVFATISTGLIGQGVLEFGPYIGPAVMALFMALWVGLLARFWAQGTVARACLFLIGMGLTFNLGRNLTFLVLWPMAMAIVAVLIMERLGRRPAIAAGPARLSSSAGAGRRISL